MRSHLMAPQGINTIGTMLTSQAWFTNPQRIHVVHCQSVGEQSLAVPPGSELPLTCTVEQTHQRGSRGSGRDRGLRPPRWPESADREPEAGISACWLSRLLLPCAHTGHSPEAMAMVKSELVVPATGGSGKTHQRRRETPGQPRALTPPGEEHLSGGAPQNGLAGGAPREGSQSSE